MKEEPKPIQKQKRDLTPYFKRTTSGPDKPKAPPNNGFAYGHGAFLDLWGDDRPKPKRKRKPKAKTQ